MRRSMSRVIRLVGPLLGLAIMAVAPAAKAEPGDAEDRLRQVLDLVADDSPGRPNRLLGDYAAVKWVQADRQRGPLSWRDRTWSDWQRRTGERPPDFDRLPSRPFLPDPLLDDDGRAIVTAADWRERRRSIIRQVEHWITGTIPPPPDNLVAETVAETTEDGLTLRTVVLRFGPDRRARLTVRLFIPQGNAPLPVVITQRNERWIRAAVRRGFIGCLYAGADGTDDLWRILAGAGEWLDPLGAVVLELSPEQAATLAEAAATLFGEVEVRADLSGRDRALVARRPLS